MNGGIRPPNFFIIMINLTQERIHAQRIKSLLDKLETRISEFDELAQKILTLTNSIINNIEGNGN